MRDKNVVITIDGPAASGKSTVAMMLAHRLGFTLVDSGAMYRAVALIAVDRGLPVDDEEALAGAAGEVQRNFRVESDEKGAPEFFLGAVDVTERIRSADATDVVSEVSLFPTVREMIGELQRELADTGRGAVAEGRDTGTAVFPDADLKVFLDAEPGERARRRYSEYREKGVELEMEEVVESVRKRDSIDSSREYSPLARADDALYVDTTSMDVSQVVDEIHGVMRARGLLGGSRRAVEGDFPEGS